jgi:NAD(P)-dependent dehydrogenase (short-subunit alcohol dehydrogenase family)
MHEQSVALVTGANKGIGKAVVRELAMRGYTVYLASRDASLGVAARASLGLTDADIRCIQLDVTDEDSIARAAREIQHEVARLDVLVNNAGISVNRDPPSRCSVRDLERTYAVNVFGVVAVTQAMLPLLRSGTARVIVNLSSELGSLALHGYPGSPFAEFNILAYCSSKTALNAFTVLLAKELRAEGFRVNAVNPGHTATDLNQFRGPRTVEQAATVIVKYATLDASGPTGGFFTENGALPW